MTSQTEDEGNLSLNNNPLLTTTITTSSNNSHNCSDCGCSDEDGDMEDVLKKSFVAESKEILRLAESEKMAPQEAIRLCEILDKYQECPTLLDPILEQAVTLLMRCFVSSCLSYDTTSNADTVNASARCLYSVVKVRGQSVPSRFFPHEVQDVSTSLTVLERLGFFSPQPAAEIGWEARYVTVLWASCLVLIPFDLCSFSGPVFLGERLLGVGKACLGDPGRTGTAAALLLARLLTRPDMVRLGHFATFVEWCCAELSAGNTPPQRLLGVLQSLFFAFKIGQRADLLAVAGSVFAAVKALRGSPQLARLGITGRKYLLKIVQRVGLVYLKARVPTWRYCRGSRFLFAGTTTANNTNKENENTKGTNEENDEEDIDVPDECEEIFDILLEGIGDRDSVARWSSAKGLGRLTGRLPLSMADDVVGSILECFAAGAGDAAWHGGCLAVAELARRGLLVPGRLGEVVPLVVQALAYDEARGSYSVGANVRDAACYVAWAFARAYAPEVMRTHVPALASALVTTALFDREVNCRRAAAAAFQEHVGRQGAFPHGIEIVTAADYFTLANRASAYLRVAPRVAAFPEYREPLLAHLLHARIGHWDKAVRTLAAQALPAFLALDPAPFVAQHIPALIPQALSSDPAARHGALLALAEVVPPAVSTGTAGGSSFPTSLAESLAALVPAMEDARLFRGRNTELIRTAMCRFVQALSEAGILFSTSTIAANNNNNNKSKLPLRGMRKRPQVLVVQDVLNDCLFLPHEELQTAAASALHAFLKTNYIRDGRVVASQNTTEKLVSECYCKRLATDPNPAVRRGCALALGSLPPELCAAWRHVVVPALIAAATVEPGPRQKELRDAETRRNAVRSLTSLCSPGTPLPLEDLRATLSALCAAAHDYATDSRGDIGSWVREAALAGIPQLCRRIAEESSTSTASLSAALADAARAIAAQVGQKIERMRNIALTAFEALVADPPLPVSCRDAICAALSAAKHNPLDFACRLLDVPELRRATVESLTLSVVAGEGSPAAKAVLAHLAATPGLTLAVANDVVGLMHAHPRSTKFAVPFIAFFAMIANSGLYTDSNSMAVVYEDFAALAGREIVASSDVTKIFAVRDAALAILEASPKAPGAPGALILVASLLAHPYPRVRKTTAEKLYAHFLLSTQELVEPALLDKLATTPWDSDDLKVTEAQKAVHEALNVDPTKTVRFRIKNTGTNKTFSKMPSNDLSYAQFMRDNLG